MNHLPERRHLPHLPPHWVKREAVFFITLCCHPRGENQLCEPKVAAAIFESVAFRMERREWWTPLLVLMPDHLHALFSFPSEVRMDRTIVTWKGFLAKHCGIIWQQGFFDHRLRSSESQQEKEDYIRMNPVRAGLVPRPEDWPYSWEYPAE